MKNKTKVVSIVLSISALMMLFSCQKQKAEWKGIIEEVDGVTVVKNPKESYYGELILDLEEDLVIGREDDKNYQFYRANDLAVDSGDNIYVADGGNSRIQKFDKNGNYILTIGEKGQGPGEFTGISDILIDEQDNLYVLGGRRIQIFNSSGEYLNGFVLETSLSNFFLDSDGFIFGISSISDREGNKSKVVKLSSEGKLIKTCTEFSEHKTVRKKSGESFVFFRAYHSYTHRLLLTALDSKTFSYVDTSKYEIFVIDKDGDLISKIQADEKSHSITQSEKDHIIGQLEEKISRSGRKWPKGMLEEACAFPSSRPFFLGMIADDLQRLYLWRVKSVLDESEEQIFDVFSKDGYFIYRIKMAFLPELVKNGYLYNIEDDDDTGEVFIKRYKIKNWKQIKTGI
ncbi:MAG: 6-bladed beta-propeller [Candidatus Aminicenantes bacterium]|nr:MAG: 6-bladed beta-propeller [Candidatus Aminicenantes bacterium]